MTTDRTRLLVIGGGGFAREVAWLAEEISESGARIDVVGFADDNPELQGTTLNCYPVMALESVRQLSRPPTHYVVAIGSPSARESLARRAELLSIEPITLVHPTVRMSRYVEIGAGTVICAGSLLTTNIRIGAHVQINLDCTVGHDAELEDFATLAPGVHVSGHVTLGRGCYLGTGCSIVNGMAGNPIRVGDRSTVGAAACVTRTVEMGTTVVGVPARVLNK
ncbi:MAG: acetyltransferase [Proteobacteria bacterium]|nr:acetyltransferase [Pseudomonadota bacterium]MBP6106661.1 acetyltransferase [Steroidobacteraceae bacterium]MBP7013262.1 acetyltransferase [Steroidobacteraceae bacterium]